MFKLSFYLGIFSLGLISACSHAMQYERLGDSEKRSVHSAICSAEAFLSKNGYHEQLPMSAKDDVELEMWDNINYEKNGVFDWDRLFSDRTGTFVGRLHGVKVDTSDEYLVYYKLAESFRCVSVDLKTDISSLREANCLVGRDLVRVSNVDVVCRASR